MDGLSMRWLSLAVLSAAILAGCGAPSGVSPLPDRSLTPGDALEVTTAEICRPGYSARARDVPAAAKEMVYRAYHRKPARGICCEIDHLIPLELGGSNRMANLWPETYAGIWNAHRKDRLEARFHSLVCAGVVDLAAAQHAIAADWVAAYRTYIAR
jgi:hypothetical protein